MKVAIVEVTDENRDSLIEVVMFSYLGDKCGFCREGFTREQLDDAVFCPSDVGRIAHGACFHGSKEGKGDE